MDIAAAPALVGIDWGTSNRRAWWLAADGSVLAERSDDQGLLACQGRFAPALEALLADGPALMNDTPVVMAGMVGSASGWQEVPYVPAGTPLAELPRQLVPVRGAARRCLIVPGMCWAAPDGSVDVMRGEETQLLGAAALGHGDGWFVLPGTHSKWVRLADAAVAEFATFLTGELFGLLTQHGTLAAVTREGPEVPEAFRRGLLGAGRSALSQALFGIRARVVTGRLPAAEARDELSGLLIGAEWAEVRRRAGALPVSVTLLGAPALARRHAEAAAVFGCRVDTLDARAAQLAAFTSIAAAL